LIVAQVHCGGLDGTPVSYLGDDEENEEEDDEDK
jgi:hypothetical protein